MVTKLTRQGDQLVLAIEPELLKKLGIDADTPVEVTLEQNDRLVISRAVGDAGDERTRKVREALEWTNQRFGKALKRLAE